MSDKTKLKAIIVDDDAESRMVLHRMLLSYPQVDVIGEADNINNAVKLINKMKPDSVFLDIQLKDESGFDLIDKLKNKPQVVFVSAFDDYAMRAFEVNAADYIKKPVEQNRLNKTIERLVNGYEHNGHDNGKLLLNKEKLDVPPEDDDEEEEFIVSTNGHAKILDIDDHILVTSDGVSKFLKVKSIMCITAEKDYSFIYTFGGKKYIVLKPMVEWEERLTPRYFIRIHRSTIVNLEYVEKVEKWFNYSYQVYIKDIPTPFQMSRRYAARLKERFR